MIRTAILPLLVLLLLQSCTERGSTHPKKQLQPERVPALVLHVPHWLQGVWSTTYVSDTRMIGVLAFDATTINSHFGSGEKTNNPMNEQYRKYTCKEDSAAGSYEVTFQKGPDTVLYEFHLQHVDYAEAPVLTFGLVVNGIRQRDHNTSCNSVYTRSMNTTAQAARTTAE